MERKLRHPIIVYMPTHLIFYLRMTRKILLFSMLLALGFAMSCKEDMPQPTPEPAPAVPETPGTPETPTNPTNPTPPSSPAEPAPSVPKPSDYRIATRMVVELIKGKKAEMLSKLEIEDFAWRGNKDAIKLEDLLPFVTFKASDLDGEPYMLTAEDLKLLELEDNEVRRAWLVSRLHRLQGPLQSYLGDICPAYPRLSP